MEIQTQYEERGNDIQIHDIEIVIDSTLDDTIEIYMLDKNGLRVEGGEFNKEDFMIVVRDFYNLNF